MYHAIFLYHYQTMFLYDLNLIRLKKDYPDLYEAFQKKAEEDKILLEQRKQAEAKK